MVCTFFVFRSTCCNFKEVTLHLKNKNELRFALTFKKLRCVSETKISKLFLCFAQLAVTLHQNLQIHY